MNKARYLTSGIQRQAGTNNLILEQHQLQNLYVAGDGIYQSYAIGSDKSLTFTGANVSDTTSCTLGVSLAVQHTSPYSIFGVAYDAGCAGVAISVDASGALVSQIANVTYDASAGVHGLALSPDSRYVYSADDMGSRVWAHAYDGAAARNYSSVAEVQQLSGAGARHLAVHPNGKWLYVIYESDNQIAVYSRDTDTGALVDTNATFSLLPDDQVANGSLYWSSDVSVSNTSSTSPKYLFAFARARSNDTDGWVNGFALDEETGAISQRIFVEQASGSGGTTVSVTLPNFKLGFPSLFSIAIEEFLLLHLSAKRPLPSVHGTDKTNLKNAVTPSPFSEEYFAVTDEGSNYVEVWEVADNKSSASAVAHLDLEYGPVNVVWSS